MATKKQSHIYLNLFMSTKRTQFSLACMPPAKGDSGIGGLTGVLLVLIFFWMLPQVPETWAARTIMGEKSYWSSAWRMLDRWSSTDADKLRALSWVEGRNGHLEHLQSCRQKALDTGRFQWCQVVFFPKDARDMTPPPPP